MLKLLKYELKKQAFSKLVILIILALLQVTFFIGLALDHEMMLGITSVVGLLFGGGAFMFMAFEAILTYNNDLKTKQSYMLFLTPRNTYQIVGAKLIASAIQVMIAGFAYLGIIIINFLITLARYDQIARLKEIITHFIKEFTGIEINYTFVISVVSITIAIWLFTIALAFLSITLSTTLLANNKFRFILSATIFLALYGAVAKLIDLVVGDINGVYLNIPAVLFKITAMLVVFTILSSIGTGWMLDKKVSV